MREIILQNGGANATGEGYAHSSPRVTLSATGNFSDGTKLYFETHTGDGDWHRIHDRDHNEIELKDECVNAVIEWLPCGFPIRAKIVGGDENTDVTVLMVS